MALLTTALGLSALLALAAVVALAPADLPGGSPWVPWPAADLTTLVVCVCWGTVVCLATASVLRSLLGATVDRVPSVVVLAACLAAGSYGPFVLVGGLRDGDAPVGAAVAAFLLTSTLVRLATDRRSAAPDPTPGRSRRAVGSTALAVVVCLAVVVAWQVSHPVQAADPTVHAPDGSSMSTSGARTIQLQIGRPVSIDLAVRTTATVRLLDLRPDLGPPLRAVALAPYRQTPELPFDVGPDSHDTVRYAISAERCPVGTVRLDALEARYVRFGATVSQRLPLGGPITIRCATRSTR